MGERQTRAVTIGGKCEGGEGRLRPVAAVPLLLEAALRLDKDGRAVDLAAPQAEGGAGLGPHLRRTLRCGVGRASVRSMIRHAVLTAIGTDRPGLVDEVTRFIADRGGNLEDSRMLNLRGQFTMMLLVAGSDATLERLRADLPILCRASDVRAEITPADAGAAAGAQAVSYKLEVWAMDHPGLLQAVAHLLRSMNVNIEGVETTLKEAPVTGTPVFDMQLVLSVPAATSVDDLRTALGRLCNEQNMSWRLTPC